MNPQTNKSEGKNDKIDALKFSHSNIKSKSKTFGEVEFKCISVGDLTFFVELLDKITDDKEFVVNVLYNQLIISKVSLIEFGKIPDEQLIELARDFIRHEKHTFECFEETTNAEFFTNFREAIKTYHQKQVERLQTVFGPMIKYSKEILEKFNKQYAGIIQTPYISESIQTVSKIAEQFGKTQLLIAESLRSAIGQSQLVAHILSERLMPQINLWQKWIEQNRAIFDNYTRFWEGFQEQYKITERKAILILRKYKWFITPSLPLSFVFEAVKIDERGSNQRKDMNKLFVHYFSVDNFKNLENLVDKWGANEIFKPRMKIFRDCIFVIRNSEGKYNPSNVVLPALIAQIDAVQQEFMGKNGLSFDLSGRIWRDERGNVVDRKTWFKNQTNGQDMLDLANNIFLNILFQRSQPGQPLETPFTFNRHKIMHGEYLRYGRIDNTIRAFLILDFLATLSDNEGEP